MFMHFSTSVNTINKFYYFITMIALINGVNTVKLDTIINCIISY